MSVRKHIFMLLEYAYVDMIYATILGKTAIYVYIYVDSDNRFRLLRPIKKRRNFIDFDNIVQVDTYRLRYFFFGPYDYKNVANLTTSHLYIYIYIYILHIYQEPNLVTLIYKK